MLRCHFLFKGTSLDVLFILKKEGEYMTDVHCNKKQCLNNCKGWCKAKAIHIDGMCRSYDPASSLINKKNTNIVKRSGRYKQGPSDVLK